MLQDANVSLTRAHTHAYARAHARTHAHTLHTRNRLVAVYTYESDGCVVMARCLVQLLERHETDEGVA
jgi:hypothetical protein